jgi:uncharacterized protein YjeT (DUF2065 family)
MAPAAEARRLAAPRIDWMSPPVLLGAAYLFGFGLEAIDMAIQVATPSTSGYRLRWMFEFDTGLSLAALLYLAAGYALFVLGYRNRFVSDVASRRPRPPRPPVPWVTSVLTTGMFIVTFGTLVVYTLRVGYGRYAVPDGSAPSGLENLSLLGELSMLPFALGMYRLALWYRTAGASPMSRFDRVFTWAVMLPLQLGIGVTIGLRSRVLAILLIAAGALHYGYRRLTSGQILSIVAFCLVLVLPGLSLLRTPAESRREPEPSLLWENVMERSSSLESFTVTFAKLDQAPVPDPLWLTIASGLVPRAIWPSKPMISTGEEFSEWVSGRRNAGFFPPLPAELLMHFGYLGGLAAMFVLGALWKLLFGWATASASETRTAHTAMTGFLYVAAMPTFLSLDAGFVSPYSVLIRFLIVGVLMLSVCRRPSGMLAPGHVLRTQPAAPRGLQV